MAKAELYDSKNVISIIEISLLNDKLCKKIAFLRQFYYKFSKSVMFMWSVFMEYLVMLVILILLLDLKPKNKD